MPDIGDGFGTAFNLDVHIGLYQHKFNKGIKAERMHQFHLLSADETEAEGGSAIAPFGFIAVRLRKFGQVCFGPPSGVSII